MRIGIAPVGACIALAPAHVLPVRRLVQGAAELRRRNKRLRHPQRIAVRSFPVVAETPLHPRPRKRGKTPKRPATSQNHKPRGVSDQVQPRKRFFAAPTHPTVPRRTTEGARLPARSAHPPPAPREHVAQTSTRKLLETKIMMTVHHTVPATHLIRPRQAHHHIPERKTLRSRLENIRGAFHDHHGYHAASQKASTNTNHPEPAEPNLPTNLAWDGREFRYTPKHGSWLPRAEIEIGAWSRPCLRRRLPDRATLLRETAAWVERRNAAGGTVDWRFTTADARVKLKSLYSAIQ